MEERRSSLTLLLIRDTPGASSKISLPRSLLSATSLPPVFHNAPFSQYTAPYSSRTCWTNTQQNTPPDANFSSFCSTTERKSQLLSSIVVCTLASLSTNEVCQWWKFEQHETRFKGPYAHVILQKWALWVKKPTTKNFRLYNLTVARHLPSGNFFKSYCTCL